MRNTGIVNTGTASLSNTTVSDNNSVQGVGGIDNSGTAKLTDSIVSGNWGMYGAGGIFNAGLLTLTNTTVSGNGSGYGGGGIQNRGTATLTNTTVLGNSSSDLTLTNTTVSGNSAGFNGPGGGIFNSGTAVLTNTIVLGNRAPTDESSNEYTQSEISGGYTQSGPNIIDGRAADVFAAIDGTTGGGLLADNGGVVETIALTNDASNPALDAGQDNRLDESVAGVDLNDDGDTADVIGTDARGSGFPRLVDLSGVANNGANTVDLGAYEAQADEPGGSDLIPVKVTFRGEGAGYANAFGVYDTSTLKAELLAADLNQTAEGAVLFEADLTQQQLATLGFFLLPDGAGENTGLASLVGEPLAVVDTGAGYAVSFNGTPLSGRDAPAFFSEASLNPGGLDHFVEDGTSARYGLSVEDLAGGGDLDFDDALFEVETGVAKTGAAVEVTFESESAGFRNTFGYFLSDSGEAKIIFADVDGVTLAPGAMETFHLTAEEYDKLEFFLIPNGARMNADLFANLDALELVVEEENGALRARDQATDTVWEGYVNPVYVPEKAGNPDATRHALQVGDGNDYKLSWEDLPDGGDVDYNDTVVGVQVAPDDVLV